MITLDDINKFLRVGSVPKYRPEDVHFDFSGEEVKRKSDEFAEKLQQMASEIKKVEIPEFDMLDFGLPDFTPLEFVEEPQTKSMRVHKIVMRYCPCNMPVYRVVDAQSVWEWCGPAVRKFVLHCESCEYNRELSFRVDQGNLLQESLINQLENIGVTGQRFGEILKVAIEEDDEINLGY